MMGLRTTIEPSPAYALDNGGGLGLALAIGETLDAARQASTSSFVATKPENAK
jgi:hypothetical protein